MNPIIVRTLRFLRSVIVAAVVAILIWTIILMIFEEKFIFFPSKYPSGLYGASRDGENIEDCWFTAEDHVNLHGWFLKSNKALATLVMAHGNAGNLSHRLEILRSLNDAGFNVFMFDYRGYGRSEGSPTEEGVYRDGRAAFDYVVGRQDVDSSRVILFGTSLGGAVAVDVALRRPASALILESTFTSAKDVARAVYPFLPVSLVMRSEYNSAEKIQRLSIPLLSMHGENDEIIPLHLGRKLFGAANEPKEFYLISGAGHNDTFFVGGSEYLERIRRFAIRHNSSALK